MMAGLLPLAAGGIEVPSIFSLLDHEIGGPALDLLYRYQDVAFCFLIVFATWGFLAWASKRYNPDRPGRLQNVLEYLVETLDNYVIGMLGKKEGRFYLPFLAGLFIYILIMNLLGLVPFAFAPTAAWGVSALLALLTFLLTQWTALTKMGPLTYFHHLCGEPKGALWLMAPLFLIIHVIGEFAKPVSLALRLFGNVLGKDVLLGVFLAISVTVSAAIGLDLLPIPLHWPFLFLGLMLGAIQALVFFLLATVYIQMALPHHEHDEHGEEH